MRGQQVAMATAVAVLVCFAITTTLVPIWDIDFWWHAASGRWILEHGALPGGDPFGMYPGESVEAEVLAKYCWGAQVLFSEVLSRTGPLGIVALRGTVLVAVLATVLSRCRRLQVPAPLSLGTVLLVAATLRHYTGERPQLFSFLAAGIVFLLAERGGLARWALPLVMVIWSNLHGGVALGGLLLLGWLAALAVEKRVVGSSDFGLLRAPLCLGAAASLACPSGISTYVASFRMQGSLLLERTSEYQTPWFVATELGKPLIGFWMLALLGVGAVLLGLRGRRLGRAALLVATLGLALSAYRYIPFFLVIAAPLIAREWSGFAGGRTERAAVPVSALAATLCVLGMVYAPLGSGSGWVDPKFPAEATRTLSGRTGQVKLFNHLNWGGYVLWQTPFTPYIDGRTLLASQTDVFPLYTNVLWATDVGRRALDGEGFTHVLVPPANPMTGEVYPLPAYLASTGSWTLLYRDERSQLWERRP